MSSQAIRRCNRIIICALLFAPLAVVPANAAPAALRGAMAQAATPAAVADYRRKLRAYQEARAAFEEEATAYWNAIAEKRRIRNARRRERQPVTITASIGNAPFGATGSHSINDRDRAKNAAFNTTPERIAADAPLPEP